MNHRQVRLLERFIATLERIARSWEASLAARADASPGIRATTSFEGLRIRDLGIGDIGKPIDVHAIIHADSHRVVGSEKSVVGVLVGLRPGHAPSGGNSVVGKAGTRIVVIRQGATQADLEFSNDAVCVILARSNS